MAIKLHRWSALLLCILTAGSAYAQAQVPEEDQTQMPDEDLVQALEEKGKSLAVSDFLGLIEIPTLLGGTTSGLGSIATQVGEEGSEVSLQLNLLDTESSFLTTRLTGPVDESDGNVTLGDLSGLKDKARLTLTWQRNPVPTPNASSPEQAEQVYERQLLLCQEYADHVESKNFSENECNSDFFDSEFSSLDRSMQERWYAINFSFEEVDYWGVEATLARDTFSFTTNEDLSVDKAQNETDVAFKAYYGRTLSLSSLYEFGYRYENSFQGSSEMNICAMIMDGTTSCRDIAVGAPIEVKKHIGFASYRKIHPNYAINVTLSHDFENDETGIQVPVWLKKNKEGLFNGGVQLDWTSENDDIMFSIFLNSPFKSWGSK